MLCAGAVAELDVTRWTGTRAVGAVAATAVAGGAAGAAFRGATLAAGGVEGLRWGADVRDTASVTQHLPRRTLTLTRRAVVGLSRSAGGSEVGSAPRVRRTREARPLPFRALAYTLLLFWSTTTEEALTEVGARTLTTSSTLGGPCHPWEGGQRAPYEGSSHQLEGLTTRDVAASQSSSKLVEVAVGSLLAQQCPLSLRAGH